MKEYRIIKKTKEVTRKVTYQVEEYHSFLFWSWWSVTEYHIGEYYTTPYIFTSFKEAYDKIVEWTEKTIIEIEY